MRTILAFTLIGMLSACSGFETQKMFRAHVIDIEKIDNLRGGKISCLHCPMYFMFSADAAITQKIASEHQLKEVRNLSEEMLKLQQLVKDEVSWWQFGNPEAQDKVYWINYKPKQAGLENAFRLLIVKKEKSFFITSGHFNRADYQAGGA